MKNSIAAKALKFAHQIKGFFSSWSDAVTMGWKIAKLFLGYPVKITFAKSCGEVRESVAIAMGSVQTFKKGFVRFLEQKGETTQWRSFRFERVILWEI